MSEQDTREQLEADVRRSLGYTVDDVFHWLDRQKAITERYWMQINGANTSANIVLNKRIAELEEEHERIVQEMVDANTRQCERTNELTAERDELQAAIGAMGNGQFYSMYKAKCEECEQLKKVVRTQADSFKKLEIELAGKDG